MAGKDKFGFWKIKHEFINQKQDIAKSVAQHSLLFFRKNFNKEGTEKDGFTKWKERKWKVNRKLLVKSGDLRDGMYVKSASFFKTVIQNDVPYGEYHQNGTATIDKREFLYASKTLDAQVIKLIENRLKKLFPR
ncbi:hypothetical protein [Rufibacter ruber]|uniref:hypothetical protein n=1 Tax=Rufibacter ruber TaxID=1783499 RepID=UPI00082A1345|nr:hypothetical protein [Rufibacter ruber]